MHRAPIFSNTPDGQPAIYRPFTADQFGHRPYARVRICNYNIEVLVPMHWFHRPQLARRAKRTAVVRCFYAGDMLAVPNFRMGVHQHTFSPQYGFLYAVNVLQVVEGRSSPLCGLR